MNNFIHTLSQMCFLTQEAKSALCDALRMEWHPAGYILQKQHQPFTAICLSVTGILHCFAEHKGETITIGYIYHGETVVPNEFPLSMLRASFSIQAIQSFSSYTIPYNTMLHLTKKFDCIENLLNTIRVNSFIKKLQEHIALQLLLPEERFIHLLNNFPAVLTHTPRQQILGYLNVCSNTYYYYMKKYKM